MQHKLSKYVKCLKGATVKNRWTDGQRDKRQIIYWSSRRVGIHEFSQDSYLDRAWISKGNNGRNWSETKGNTILKQVFKFTVYLLGREDDLFIEVIIAILNGKIIKDVLGQKNFVNSKIKLKIWLTFIFKI